MSEDSKDKLRDIGVNIVDIIISIAIAELSSYVLGFDHGVAAAIVLSIYAVIISEYNDYRINSRVDKLRKRFRDMYK